MSVAGHSQDAPEMTSSKPYEPAYGKDRWPCKKHTGPHEQATKLLTLNPGAQVVSTPATTKNTHPSGGVAVVLPVGYELIMQIIY